MDQKSIMLVEQLKKMVMVFYKPSATTTKSGSSGSNGVKQMPPKAADLARVYTYMICQNNVLQARTGSHHVNFPATSVKSEVERAIYCVHF